MYVVQRELEWHQDDRVDVCFRITDMKAGMMLVPDDSTHLLFESFSSPLLSFEQYEAI